MHQRVRIAQSGKKSLRDRSGRRRSTIMLKAAVLILPLFLVACNDAAATAAGDLKGQAKPQAGKDLPSAVAQSEDPGVTGTVVETMDAGAYTYVRMKTAKGDVWAAVNQTSLKPGAEITIGNAMWMENFESKTLNRKFDHILFGTLAGGDETAALPPGHPPTSGAAAPVSSQAGADQGDVKVEKAAGKDARTVAEIWAQKASLKDQEVVVRARVVKFNAEIMGRNWMHLRDGSGSAEKGDNDITVTTMEVVAKGDVVTIRGKVGVDKDFTSGYAYPVIIEEAKVVK
jgi:hypothetical protein